MSDFADRLSALVAMEMSQAHGDADRMAEVLERLTASVGFTIAIMAGGRPDAANKSCGGRIELPGDGSRAIAEGGEGDAMTPKDALIEKMARAIARADGWDLSARPRSTLPAEDQMDIYRQVARAAYEAEHEGDPAHDHG